MLVMWIKILTCHQLIKVFMFMIIYFDFFFIEVYDYWKYFMKIDKNCIYLHFLCLTNLFTWWVFQYKLE